MINQNIGIIFKSTSFPKIWTLYFKAVFDDISPSASLLQITLSGDGPGGRARGRGFGELFNFDSCRSVGKHSRDSQVNYI